jgi:hypothetical protein
VVVWSGPEGVELDGNSRVVAEAAITILGGGAS